MPYVNTSGIPPLQQQVASWKRYYVLFSSCVSGHLDERAIPVVRMQTKSTSHARSLKHSGNAEKLTQ
jgi:hypothetical protein